MEKQENPGLGLCSSDWEVFQRVWRRVMPQERPGQPVELVPQGEVSPPMLPAPVMPAQSPYDPRESQERWPAREGVLGPESQGYGGDLQGFLAQELADAKTYGLLSRSTSGQVARSLASLSAQNRHQAKRLSTAYFLLSGVRYWPEGHAPGNTKGGLLHSLRRQFVREQRRAMDYRTAEAATHDGYLKELYLILAETADHHTWSLRDILEGL